MNGMAYTTNIICSIFLRLFSQYVPVHSGRQPNSQTPLNLLQFRQFGPQVLAQFVPYRPVGHTKLERYTHFISIAIHDLATGVFFPIKKLLLIISYY